MRYKGNKTLNGNRPGDGFEEIFEELFVVNRLSSIGLCYTKLNLLPDMAKGSNLITHKVRGPLGNLQLVNDPRYGEYLRVKRGTIKPALLNDECKVSSGRLVVANHAAKAIYNAIRHDHKGYYLWNDLVSIFRRQLKAGIPFHLNDLKDMECHHEYKLEKLIATDDYHIDITEKEGKLHICLSIKSHPDWSFLEWKRDFQYRLSIVTVFPDLATGDFVKETVHGPVTSFKAAIEPLSFEVPVPVVAKNYLVFLRAATCENGEMATLARLKGMRVVATDELRANSS